MKKIQLSAKKIKTSIIVIILLGAVVPIYCYLFKQKQIETIEIPSPKVSREEMLITIDDSQYLYGKVFREYTSGYGSDMKIFNDLNIDKNDLEQNLGLKLESKTKGNSVYQLKERNGYDYLLMEDCHTGEISLWKWIQGTDGQSLNDIWQIVGVDSEKSISKIVMYPAFYNEKNEEQVKEIIFTSKDIERFYKHISNCRGNTYDFADEDNSEEFIQYWDLVITTNNGFDIELTYDKGKECFFQRSLELDSAQGILFNTVNGELSNWLGEICHVKRFSKNGVYRRTKYKNYYEMLREIPEKDYTQEELQKSFHEFCKNLDLQDNIKFSQCYESIEILKDKKCILILLKEEYREKQEIQDNLKQLIDKSDILVIR